MGGGRCNHGFTHKFRHIVVVGVVVVVVVDIWIDVEEKGGFASVITRGGDC